MTTLNRVVINWSGSSIKGTAVTVLHYDGSDNSAPPISALRAAFAKLTAAFPAGTTLAFPVSGDRIDSATGHLVGGWSAAGVGDVVATGGSTNGAAGVGACITWSTGGIVNGSKGPRRLRGRTFLVPLCTDAYDTSGTLANTFLTAFNTFGNDMMASGPLGVWHRPTTPGGSDGNSYGVQSFKVRDKVAYLKSRRD